MHIHITKLTSELGLIDPVGGSPRREAQECQLRRLITIFCWLWGQITKSLRGRVRPVYVLLGAVGVISPWVSLNPL